MEFQVRYLALFLLFFSIRQLQVVLGGSLHKNIKLMLEFFKAPFSVLHFSYYILMTLMMMLPVILLSMLMILLSRVWLIFWKHCHENLSFRKHMLEGKGWKHLFQQIFLAHRTIYSPQLLKTNLLSETIVSEPQLAFIYSNSAIIEEQSVKYV